MGSVLPRVPAIHSFEEKRRALTLERRPAWLQTVHFAHRRIDTPRDIREHPDRHFAGLVDAEEQKWRVDTTPQPADRAAILEDV